MSDEEKAAADAAAAAAAATSSSTSDEDKAAADAASKAATDAAATNKAPDPKGDDEAAKVAADEAAAKEAADKNETPLDTTVWGDMEDDTANAMLQTLQNSGVSPTDAKALLWDAVEKGDPSLIDHDALVEKVGKANATLIMSGVRDVTSRSNNAIAEVTAMAYEAAGDEANWKKAVDWARKGMSEDDLAEYRGMLSNGGKQAKFAANEIVALYNADPKNTALKAGEKQINGDSPSTKTDKGITRAEFNAAQELLFNRKRPKSEHDALQARRRLGRKNNI